jgi:hypothetical protein
MKRDLAALNRTVKEFLHHDGYDNIRAMDLWVGLKNLEPDQLWGPDPVHIQRNHMEQLVRGVNITLEKVSPKKRRESTAGDRTAKRIPLDGETAGTGNIGTGGQGGTGNSAQGSTRYTARGSGNGGGRGILGERGGLSGGSSASGGHGYSGGGMRGRAGHNRSLSEQQQAQQQQYGRWRGGGQQGYGRRW